MRILRKIPARKKLRMTKPEMMAMLLDKRFASDREDDQNYWYSMMMAE